MAIEIDKVVGINYTLTDADTGEQLDSNEGKDPLEFITGKGQIIEGLEEKIATMSEGEETEVTIEPAKAYGETNPEMKDELPIEQFAGIELQEGMTLYGQGQHGETIQVTVESFDDKTVKIDYNHPMAGKTLKFQVQVVSVRAATEEEVAIGIVGGYAAGGSCCGGGSCGDESGHKHEGESCCGGEGHGHDHGNGGGCGCSH
jgi:FKBP-type peptidyl-prolyl cis-trans isomerase SlyD